MSDGSDSRLGRDGDMDREVVEIVVDGGYHPAQVSVAAGRPLRLIFRRQEDRPCSERVILSPPRLERRLAAMATTVIDLPAPTVPEVRFTCSMGRYRGRIAVVDRSSRGDRPRPSLRLPSASGVARLVTLLAAAVALAVAAGASSAAVVALGFAVLVAVSLVVVGRRMAEVLGRVGRRYRRGRQWRRGGVRGAAASPRA